MTTLYKLTDEQGRTHNRTQWGEGVSHSGTGEGGLCGPGYIHAYEHPLIAVFMNPVHADFPQPLLWEAEGEIALRDGHLKCGCVTLTTIRELPLPVLTTDQRVRIARECVRRAANIAASSWWTAAARDAANRARAEARVAETGTVVAAVRAAIDAAIAAATAVRAATIGAAEWPAGRRLPLPAIIQQVLSEDSQP